MADRVHRVTMFKLPKQEDQEQLIEQYKTLEATAKLDGKPYILSVVVGPAEEDARSQGFTLISKSEFASLEDMKYYDDQCEAHQALKSFAMEKCEVKGLLTVYFKPQVVGGCAA